MSTKGKSNLYGRGKRGKPDDKINYKYARYLSHKHQEDHIIRHGIKEMGLTVNQYKSQSIAFSNKNDRTDHISFVTDKGVTHKYSLKTKEYAIITKEGIVATYFKMNKEKWEGVVKQYERKKKNKR